MHNAIRFVGIRRRKKGSGVTYTQFKDFYGLLDAFEAIEAMALRLGAAR